MTARKVTPGQFGVHVYRSPGHEVARPCNDCPFKMEREGTPFLPEERMDGIKFAVTMGQPFWCHKTIYQRRTAMIEDEDGFERAPNYQRHYKVCAGAIEWAEAFKIEQEKTK